MIRGKFDGIAPHVFTSRMFIWYHESNNNGNLNLGFQKDIRLINPKTHRQLDQDAAHSALPNTPTSKII